MAALFYRAECGLTGVVDLKEAAQRLGVHYQTAYRWVREGMLSAGKIGSSYEIDEDDLEAFMARRATPAPPPKVTRVRDWDAQADRLHHLLLAGDELGARALVDRLHHGGHDCVLLCEKLLAPVLQAIGEDWAAGRITVAHEHRAAAICERLLSRAAPHPRGRPRGVAVVCTPPGELHGLPSIMAAMTLRADRWKVHHLGAQVPLEDLKAFIPTVDANLVVLSVTMREEMISARTIAEHLDGVCTLIGGPGRPLAELRTLARAGRRMAGDGVSDDVSEACL